MPSSAELIINEPVEPIHTPFNERYHRRIADYERSMVEAAEIMLPWQIEAAGLYFQKMPNGEIGKSVKKRLSTVIKFLNTPECKLLLRLKAEKDAFEEGPSIAVRKNWLANIVEDKIIEDPKEARGAIQELNRMDNTGQGAGGQTLNITINNVLQRGALDG